MKKLKQCNFEQMMAAVLPLLRFNQQRTDVEARIEHLVKRGNLEVTEVEGGKVEAVESQAAPAEGKDGMEVDEEAKQAVATTKTKRIVKYVDWRDGETKLFNEKFKFNN